jgi:peptide-methionine (S)-S-oxide reductase
MTGRTVWASGLLAAAVVLGYSQLPAAAADRTVLAPAATTDVTTTAPRAVAVLAGGCFWGMEAVFSHLNGVQQVSSGYAGGDAATANYDAVSRETTRHAEAIRIVYDPRRISYATLLRVYFSVAHDPTQLNRQGPDTGTSYRSAVFPLDAEQLRVARVYIAQLNAAKTWGKPLATRIESGRFFPAETYHQDFAFKNPNHGYIRMWDSPKIAALQKTFPTLWRAKPSA